jgi:hypothetical protein
VTWSLSLNQNKGPPLGGPFSRFAFKSLAESSFRDSRPGSTQRPRVRQSRWAGYTGGVHQSQRRVLDVRWLFSSGAIDCIFNPLHSGYAWPSHQELIMLWTVFTTLLVLWLLGIVSAYTFGGFIHVLLASAIAVVLLRVLQNPGPPE